jgi:hypothetical protein
VKHLALAVTALSACGGGDRPVFAPIIEVPPEGSDAYPWTGLDELVLEIAEAGAADGSRESFAIGEPLELTDIDYGEAQVVHLSGRTNGVEVAYGRTCAVDIDADSVGQAPHLYFSRMVKWGPGADPGAIGGADALAYSAPGGSGVFVGDGRVTRFDPVAGAFAEVPIDSIAARAGGILAPVPDGRAILIGGTAAGDGVPLVEAIDPNEPPVSASRVEQQPGPRLVDHAAVTLVDGSVLVAGGRLQDEAGAFAATRTAWLVHFGGGNTLDEPEQLATETVVARHGHTMTRLGDDVGAAVVVIGGRDVDGLPIATAELYRPLSTVFEPIATAVLAVPRWNHRAVRLPDGSVLIIGGRTLAEAATQVELYDPVLGVFKDTQAVLRSDDAVTDMAVVPMPDGRVLLIGGRDAEDRAVATVLIARFDPVNGQVDLSVTDPLERPRAGHSATILCDGTILVVGGGAGAERYNTPSAGRR